MQADLRSVLLARWIIRSAPLEIVGSSGHEKVTTSGKPEANLKHECHFCALSLTPEHRQLRLQWCQARPMWNVTDWQKVVFSDESRFVLGTDDNRIRVWRHPEPVWDQLKRQMPLCHSVHDLELAVQDSWSHLSQDNIRCLINSMADRVVACITAGGGPTRY
ncbi:uncharacterized protein TNCV_1756551 [Trichonephila clavipes]|nr:uncharacterized protein TNCV_1756551 [Trichonephila clavipes]